MNSFECQFRWGGRHSAFGVDVDACTVEEALAKANLFFNNDATLSPVNHPDAENNIEEVEKWVMGFGTHATVVRPRTLADLISARAKELTRRYEVCAPAALPP